MNMKITRFPLDSCLCIQTPVTITYKNIKIHNSDSTFKTIDLNRPQKLRINIKQSHQIVENSNKHNICIWKNWITFVLIPYRTRIRVYIQVNYVANKESNDETSSISHQNGWKLPKNFQNIIYPFQIEYLPINRTAWVEKRWPTVRTRIRIETNEELEKKKT